MNLKIIKDILFPAECLFCNRPGEWLCAACLKKIKINSAPRCLGCRRASGFGALCPDCRPNYHLDAVFTAGDYDDPLLGTAIKKFKYHFLRELGEPLGKFLSFYVSQEVLLNPILAGRNNQRPGLDPADDFLAVPVPLAKKRQKWRGFNQSLILAEAVARRFNWELSQDLKRPDDKKPQAGFTETERKNNAQNIFTWSGRNLGGRRIILIDDVATTGATLNDGARALKAAGAEKVYGLAAAKG